MPRRFLLLLRQTMSRQRLSYNPPEVEIESERATPSSTALSPEMEAEGASASGREIWSTLQSSQPVPSDCSSHEW